MDRARLKNKKTPHPIRKQKFQQPQLEQSKPQNIIYPFPLIVRNTSKINLHKRLIHPNSYKALPNYFRKICVNLTSYESAHFIVQLIFFPATCKI